MSGVLGADLLAYDTGVDELVASSGVVPVLYRYDPNDAFTIEDTDREKSVTLYEFEAALRSGDYERVSMSTYHQERSARNTFTLSNTTIYDGA